MPRRYRVEVDAEISATLTRLATDDEEVRRHTEAAIERCLANGLAQEAGRDGVEIDVEVSSVEDVSDRDRGGVGAGP